MVSVPPSVKSPGEGQKFQVGPLAIVNLVAPDQTGGAFEMYEVTLGPATVDYHIHRNMDETIYVAEGQVEFNVHGEKFLRSAGSVAFFPRGTHHGFTNPGPANAKVIIVFAPSGKQQEFFGAMEKLLNSPSPDAAAIQALQKQYDQELLEPGT